MLLPGDGRAGCGDYKGNEETFGCDEYTHYLDYGDGLIDIYICQKSSNLHSKYAWFIVSYASGS